MELFLDGLKTKAMTYTIQKKWTNARKSEYNGILYDSNFEAAYAQELDLRQKAKDIKGWERQVTLDLRVNDFLVCTYRIDFIIHHNDGTLEYVETKGWATPLWRLKWKLFEALYSNQPAVKLTVVKQNSRWQTEAYKKRKAYERERDKR